MTPATEADANPVRIALMKLLKADAKLKELAGGVFYRKAAQPTEVPYVIVSKQAGSPEWTFGGPPTDNEIWLIKGVGSANQAEAIDRRVKELLNPSTELEIDGKEFFLVIYEGDVDYEDNTDGEQYQHVGAEYRTKSEEEA